MDVGEFKDFGYLQELNRRFLHPLGLSLMVEQDKHGTWRLAGIWDYRDDLEGIICADGVLSFDKQLRVNQEMIKRDIKRLRKLGFVIQPVFKHKPMKV